MYRPETTAIGDSNLANFGSDLEHKIKEAAAACEKAWDGVGVQAGLRVWRIEKFQVVEWPVKQLGRFYNGDSYILLHSYKHPNNEKLHHDVHFWLGEETSQDESGTAAYKTVELDDRLGGAPVQHREVQGHESDLFLSYFPEHTVEILKGGVDSGFNHVEPEKYEPRLLHVKGTRKNVRVTQVAMDRDSLNSGDVFILDLGLELIQWNGANASLFEKMRAGQMTRALRDERHGKPEATLQDEGDKSDEMDTFWSHLGGDGPIKSASAGGSDAAAAAEAAESVKLFRLSDKSGSLNFSLEKTGNLSKSDLDSSDAFLLDNGAEVFVWIGKRASHLEKKKGMFYAQQYLTDNNRPSYLPISRVMDGGENEVFNLNFSDGYGVRSRGMGGDEVPENFRPSCCPHHPTNSSGSSRWGFTQNQSSSVASLASKFGGGRQNSSTPSFSQSQSKPEKDDDLEKIATEVFGFFKNKIMSKLMK